MILNMQPKKEMDLNVLFGVMAPDDFSDIDLNVGVEAILYLGNGLMIVPALVLQNSFDDFFGLIWLEPAVTANILFGKSHKKKRFFAGAGIGNPIVVVSPWDAEGLFQFKINAGIVTKTNKFTAYFTTPFEFIFENWSIGFQVSFKIN